MAVEEFSIATSELDRLEDLLETVRQQPGIKAIWVKNVRLDLDFEK